MEKTDYEEPMCPMDTSMWDKDKTKPIPTERIIQKEDAYLAKNDYASAERHLLYWMEEANRGNDGRGRLLLCNELMGLYRKLGNGEKAVAYAKQALDIVEDLGLGETVAGATAFLNAGTVYKAFGEPEKSLAYFERTETVYENVPGLDCTRKAGLYNNMALTLADLGRFGEAKKRYTAALEIVKNESRADEAITWLNLADCIVAEKGAEEAESAVSDCLKRAEDALNAVPDADRDGYYAFVCEKCASVFDYYGYFFFAGKLRGRAKAIYTSNV